MLHKVTGLETFHYTGKMLSRVVLFRDLYDGFQIRWLDLLTLIHSQSSRLQAITALSLFLQLTVTHVLGFSVFTSHILVTELSQSHCHCSTHVFFSQIKFFLVILLQLPTQFNTSAPNLISWHAGVPKFDSSLFSFCLSHSQSQSHIATDGQSVSLGVEPHLGLMTRYVTFLFLWSALSDARTGLSFVYAAGPCQRSLSRVRVPWDSRPYFTVSDLRLPFSSLPTTRLLNTYL
jgi:hypothetical protein